MSDSSINMEGDLDRLLYCEQFSSACNSKNLMETATVDDLFLSHMENNSLEERSTSSPQEEGSIS